MAKSLLESSPGKSGNVDGAKDLAYTTVWYVDVKIQPGSKASLASASRLECVFLRL